MKFTPELIPATLLKRYKRFLADVESGGKQLTVHCPNTGSMQGCIVEGSACWLSKASNPKRKYGFTWELATTATGHLAGINTGRANALVVEAIENGLIGSLGDYCELQTEQKYGGENSRIDILLSTGEEHCYVEVKSVTLGMVGGLGLFPDAVSQRASKHLRELMKVRALGHRAVLVFCVQHTGIEQVAPAETIDPVYAATLRKAVDSGVEVLAYGADISPNAIALTREVPVVLV